MTNGCFDLVIVLLKSPKRQPGNPDWRSMRLFSSPVICLGCRRWLDYVSRLNLITVSSLHYTEQTLNPTLLMNEHASKQMNGLYVSKRFV